MSLDIQVGANVSEASQKLTKFYADLKKSINEVNTTVQKSSNTFQGSTEKMTESVKSFAKASQNSLTAVSLAIQDLPFGFIGIQNNLPGIIQGLGQMTQEAKTGAPVMTQLATALMGPAGLFLAFSAVTSIVTILTMKYGSFGEAMNAIFAKTNALSGKIKELSDSYEQFNKNLRTSQDIVGQEAASATGQIAKVESLSKIVLDQTKSYNERNAALNALKEINKDYFGNLDLETTKLGTVKAAVDAYKNSIIAAAVTKGFEEEIGRTNVELSKQESLLKKLDEAKKTAERAPQKIIGKADQVDTREIKQAESAYNKQLLVVKELTKRKEELNAEIKKSIDAQIALRAPVDATNAALERQKEIDKQSIGKIVYGEGDVGTLTETSAAFKQKLLMANMRIWWGDDGMLSKELDKALIARKELLKKKNESAITDLVPKKLDKTAGAFVNKNPLIEYQFGQITAIIDALKEEAKFIDDAFRVPLENLFIDFLQKGKLSFEDFTKSVVKNIGQIVAKLAASKIFEALANLIPQIAGTLLPGGSQILQVTKFLGTGRSIFGAANLSGLDGGGMNLNGQVVFVQRGTDLVGVMNRTNSQISRIG